MATGRRGVINRRGALALGALAALLPTFALAHTGAAVTPATVARAWHLDPLLLLGLSAGAWCYGVGVRVLWRRAGVGGGVTRWQVAAAALGWLALVVALVSPLDQLAGTLFAAHMSQHLLLTVVAAPLLVLAAPLYVWPWALPLGARRWLARGWRRATWPRAVWRGLTTPLVAGLLHVAALWLWHLPRLYQAALANETVHAVEHATLLGTAALVWWALIAPLGRRRIGGAGAALALFLLMLQSSALGALLTFAPTPWYPAYAAGPAAWGLTPLDDQRLAGLIMWVPGGLPLLGAALVLVGRWLAAAEREEPDTAAVWSASVASAAPAEPTAR